MNKEIKAMWLEGLTSGAFAHITGKLRLFDYDDGRHDGDGACPRCGLGVLLDILPLTPRGDFTAQKIKFTSRSCTYGDRKSSGAYLPTQLLEELGLTEQQQEKVFRLNDLEPTHLIEPGQYPPALIDYIRDEL